MYMCTLHLHDILEMSISEGVGLLEELPLLIAISHSSAEDQERHLLVKVIDRILYKLDDLVRPYVHKVHVHVHV